MPADESPKSSRRYAPIGKYDLLAHIATGGMGAIYKAHNRETGQIVALKVLAPSVASKPTALERFRREANRGMKLRHDNLVSLYECGEERGINYLAMEFVEGQDLHEYINRKGMLDPDEAVLLLTQAARALDYLHQQQVVHRDIKPSNFLITQQDGQPHLKLTDFGLARDINADEFRLTRSGFTVGTIDYMSPEQGRDSGLADIRSDIYSLGCTFYHMLTGRPPFGEGGLAERLYKHAEALPPDPREINPKVSPAVATVLNRMLAKQPINRYQTPAELLEDLERIRLGQPPKGLSSPAQAPPTRASPALEVKPRPAPAVKETPPAPPPPSSSVLEVNPEHLRAAAGQFERANQVIATGNFDYGIHLLLSCCKLDPANIGYRQTLRRLEKKKYQNNRRGSWLAFLTTLPPRARLKAAKQAGDHLKVLEHGEEVLTRNPWDLGSQLDMAEAAEALGLLDLAVWILEHAWSKEAHTPPLNKALAYLYEKRGQFSKANALWKLVLKGNPNDVEAHRQLKNLAAKETITRGHYEEALETLGEEPSP
ncbi:MAG: protein kinase [Planctomycetes bacterium]|nr:protein kinase [Planctomycetota bacterium]